MDSKAQKAAGPPDNDPGTESGGDDYFISLCIHGADEIRARLQMDELGYSRTAPFSHSRARDYYLYGVLDEIERAGTSLVRLKELLKDEQPDAELVTQRDRRIHRNLLTAVRDEEFLRIRELTELLVELINFGKTNAHEYFKHYLLCRYLDDYRKLQTDFSDYHGCTNRNIQQAIDHLRRLRTSLETKIDHRKCWYLQFSKSGVSNKLSSFKDRFNLALGSASPAERAVLGLSYEMAFSRVSRGVHPNIGSPDNEVSWQGVLISKGEIEILAMHVLLRCRQLIRLRSKKGIMAQAAQIVRSNRYPTEIYNEIARAKVSRGDYVIAYSDLGEVPKIDEEQVWL